MTAKGVVFDSARFVDLVAAMPLVSVDLVLVRGGTEVLLGLRNNRPAQGFWFVPGGRVLKDEPRQRALTRVAQRELGLSLDGLDVRFAGAYEHFYPDCFAGDVGVSTHYVVLAHRIDVPAGFEVELGDVQHEALRWWPLAQAAQDESVHAYSRAYLKDEQA
jgi:colanic acid biosynthesis protein WcaH